MGKPTKEEKAKLEEQKTTDTKPDEATDGTKPNASTGDTKPEATGDTKSEATGDTKSEATGDTEADLFTIEKLADKYRVPTWQSAALRRLMAWGEGKRVTEAEYETALKRLRNRPLGG